MSQKTYLYILRSGVILTLLCVFFVFKNLLFPYITSKQIPFNIMVEILAIFWIAFIVKYKEWRPQWSYITFGIMAFAAAIVLSCFTGADFNLSFWGDIERMLGVFHILHFFLLYLIIITAFRSYADWNILLVVSLIFSMFVSWNQLSANGNAFATIGNTAYVSGYFLFNMFFAFILFFREKNKGLRWLYLLPLPFLWVGFRKADTAGAYVGLAMGLMVMAFLFGVLSKNKKIKIASWTTMILMVAFISYFFVFQRDNFLTRSNVTWKNLTNEVSFTKNTFQTRLVSWRAAAKDFKAHPFLGTGWGNYALTFDKYFDPKFYDYTKSETYFDRAHNNLIDIASTSGLLGVLTYLSIFAAVAYYLVAGYRKGRIGMMEMSLLSGLIVAYFVQNLAVFDSLVTYMGLMITLGYIYWLYREDREENPVYSKEPLNNNEIVAFAVGGLILLTILYQFNIKPYKMLVATIKGQIVYAQSGGLEAATEAYKEALSYNTVLDRDSRTSYNRLAIANPSALKNMDAAKAQGIMDYAIELAEANVKYNVNDSLNQMLLAQTLDVTSMLYAGNEDKFKFYHERALEAVDKSIAASPGRIPIYFQKAQIYLTAGQTNEAVETLKYSITLNEKYADSYCHLGRTYLFLKNEKDGYGNLDKCIELDGANVLNTDMIKTLINHYAASEDWVKLRALYEALSSQEPKDTKVWISLAKIYMQLGDKEKAKAAAQKAGELDPSIKSYADQFVNQIDGMK